MTIQSFCVYVLLLGIFGFKVHGDSSEFCPQKQETFNGKLKMDTAFVNITSTLKHPVSVLGISSNCYKCPLQVLEAGVVNNTFVIVKTHYSFILTVKNGSRELCSLEYLFGERGWYEFTVTVKGKCNLKEVRAPENSYMPLWIAFVGLCGMALLWVLLTFIKRKCEAKCKKTTSSLDEEENEGENAELKITGTTESQAPAENAEVTCNGGSPTI